MKRTVWIGLAVMMMVGATVSFAAAQSGSLGDYARSVRKEKKTQPAKQYDNDNLPQNEKLSVVGPDPAPVPAAGTTDPNAAPDAAKTDAQKADDAAKASKPVNERQKANDEWKTKIENQKAKLDLASRELDVLRREYQLRAAAMYADAGNRLRNAGAWDKEDQQYKKEIADKQKAVDDAKQDLDDVQEKARKSGVPNKDRE